MINFKKKMEKEINRIKEKLNLLRDSLNESISKKQTLDRESKDYRTELEEVISFYEISKELSKSLKVDEIFKSFKEKLSYHLRFSDCLLKENEEAIADYEKFPLRIEKDKTFFLYLKGLEEKDKENFSVFLNQLTLVLRRSSLYERLQELAITDSLTGLFSRRYMLERSEDELKRSKKFNLDFSLLLADIDHFKSYNDRYGHLVGDQILRNLGRTIKMNIRLIDLAARFGGEEFLILLPETDKIQAVNACERIRKAIEIEKIKAYDENLSVSCSFGIAGFPQDSLELADLIDKADFALYQAKKEGRNKVCMYSI